MSARLAKIAGEFRRGMIGRRKSVGWCWMISQPLSAFLKINGHDCKTVEGIVDGDPHVWIEFADGRILDATADQFGTKRRPMPKVFIGPKPKNYLICPHKSILDFAKLFNEADPKTLNRNARKAVKVGRRAH